VITTERLVLRRWREDDVEPLATILCHPDVARWLGTSSPSDVALTVERYEHSWDTLGFGRFAVTDRATGRLIGRAGIMRQDAWTATEDKVEVGWAIDRASWGQGLATEAALAVVDDGFTRVGLRRLLSWTLPENVASRRVMEKCGFAHMGTASWAGRPHVWYARARLP
jgi:RimJ/RimL family protein N-acetyltransferase